MLDFRILGPLEVRDEEAPIALGGPRQRALLAALLLRAGRVVPTEQLVDELYGADPPQTATASLQNAVVALRKALGPDVLVTRPPGYVLQSLGRAGRRAPLRAAARRREGRRTGASVGRSSGARSTSGAARRSPSSPSKSGRRPRLGGSTSSGSSRVEERIATDVELGRAADVVPELESLVREHPLRERPCELLMRALYAAGRHADALDAFDAHRAALDELGLEPGEAVRRLQASILRHEAGLHARAERRRRTRRRRRDRQGARRRARRARARARRRRRPRRRSSRPPSATRATARSTSPASRSTSRR